MLLGSRSLTTRKSMTASNSGRLTARYHKDEHPICTMPPHGVAEVFLLEESRKADKTGCISLLGTTYEVEAKHK